MEMTESDAGAIGWDAGNAHMKAAGRDKWNADDYRHALATVQEMLDRMPAQPTYTKGAPQNFPEDDRDQT